MNIAGRIGIAGMLFQNLVKKKKVLKRSLGICHFRPSISYKRLEKSMRYSSGHDKFVCNINDHKLLKDKYQYVLQHPSICPNKGSSLDKRKTFYPEHLLEWGLDKCGLEKPEGVA